MKQWIPGVVCIVPPAHTGCKELPHQDNDTIHVRCKKCIPKFNHSWYKVPAIVQSYSLYSTKFPLCAWAESVCLLSHERRREPQRGFFFLTKRPQLWKIPLDLPNSDFWSLVLVSYQLWISDPVIYIVIASGRDLLYSGNNDKQIKKTLSMYIWACEYWGQAWKNANT